MDDFIHIPKASGSTLRTVLSQQYGGEHVFYYEPDNPIWRDRDSTAALERAIATQTITLLTGHHKFGLHSVLKTPIRYFSMLRDPISRAISDYYYAYSYQHHRLREEILRGDLAAEDYLTSKRFGLFDAQCAMLVGDWSSESRSANVAYELAERSFVAVGVTEYFDESLLYIAKQLGWRPPLYVTRNVTKLPSDIAAERNRVEEAARKNHSHFYDLDLDLHDRVTRLLLHRIEDEGSAFSNALAAYREMQRVLEKSNDKEKFNLFEFGRTDAAHLDFAGLAESEPYRVVEDYLRASSAPKAPPKNYAGALDTAAGRIIAGWALDLFNKEPIEVRIYRSGVQVGAARCAGNRQDVAHTAWTRADVGFHVELSEEIANPREVRVCFEDSSIPLSRMF